MKKWISWVLAVCSLFCFAGCGGNGDGDGDTPDTSCQHSWGAWQNITPPTCVQNGVKKRVCANCGEEETGAIVNPSKHDLRDSGEQEPTCLESGCKSYVYCVREGCNYSLKKDSDILAPYGHNWVGYGCSECEATTSEYYLINFSRKFDNDNITSYNNVDLSSGNITNSGVKYYEWKHDHGDQNFRLLHRDGVEGIYWRKGGLTLDFETDTFKFRCTDMHQDLGDKQMEVYMIFKTASGTSHTKRLTLESKTPTSGGWYECVVKVPDNLKVKTVVCFYFHADAFNVDDIRAVENA